MLLKLKNYEFTIKGIRCTDGRKQRNCLSKQDTTSPTVSTEELILMHDWSDGRTGRSNCLNSRILPKNYYDKGYIHINTEGEMVTVLKEIDPGHYKDFIYLYRCGR